MTYWRTSANLMIRVRPIQGRTCRVTQVGGVDAIDVGCFAILIEVRENKLDNLDRKADIGRHHGAIVVGHDLSRGAWRPETKGAYGAREGVLESISGHCPCCVEKGLALKLWRGNMRANG
ncbi:uncharacterized protein MELLADRAFT_110353 [Melampsora larici-populina 98AG31]|uniref:Uncharacterized protein n=1 Tax=Melampsora larici-populina (strain 98AG31 / pathotype 3-4-7) TaxID=747676 RepID=F4RZH6_MELLP|nr:uncharacterized protein MELLADRAFT_110353 [Melampsora larici-populina 98AG31]EGG02253.1 hypothetical protein MELLADRAFT_110353 [Melampsora larici-populina 98AG31]